jgi:copper chaperone NosL
MWSPNVRISRRGAARGLLAGVCVVVLPSLFVACATRGTRPIAVGADSCAHCRMSIDDPRLAAEAVAPSGKVLTFDSVECLIDYLAVAPADRVGLEPWVARFSAPDEFLDARTAQFTESPALRGPMGGAAILAGSPADVHNGMRLTWNTLRARRAASTAR